MRHPLRTSVLGGVRPFPQRVGPCLVRALAGRNARKAPWARHVARLRACTGPHGLLLGRRLPRLRRAALTPWSWLLGLPLLLVLSCRRSPPRVDALQPLPRHTATRPRQLPQPPLLLLLLQSLRAIPLLTMLGGWLPAEASKPRL